MLADSGLLQELERHAFSPTGNPMALYGDPAYPLRVHLIVPYRGAGITAQMEGFNNSMSSVRTSVEWLLEILLIILNLLILRKLKRYH